MDIEDLYRRDFAPLARKYSEDAAQDAFEELLIAQADGKPITRSLLWTIAAFRATDEHREDTRQRTIAERVAVNDSRIREQQALYSAAEPHKAEQEIDDEPSGMRPGELLGFPVNTLGGRTWS